MSCITVYIDLVILLNFVVDLLLLKAVAGLLFLSGNNVRCMTASAIGGIYGGICLLPGWSFFASAFWRTIILLIIVVVAFGVRLTTLRAGGLFCLLTLALGGAAAAFGTNTFMLVLTAGGVFALCYFTLGANRRQIYSPVKVRYAQNEYDVTALLDTGNTLKDPVTGRPAIVVGADIAYAMLRISAGELSMPIETMCSKKYTGLSLIPYCSVGKPDGFLLCIHPDAVWVNGKRMNACVAFAPQNIGNGSSYQALIGGII